VNVAQFLAGDDKQESSPFNGFIDSRFRGNDKKVRFSKVSN